MIKKQKILISVISILIIALLVSIIISYFNNQDKQTIKDFGLKRGQIMQKYAYVIIGISPQILKDNLKICDQYSTYISYFDKDTRQMPIADLRDAISLNDSCASDVTSSQYSLNNDLSSSISELAGINVKFKNPELTVITTKIFNDWRNIELLSSEKTDLEADAVNREKEIWDAELGYKLGNNSFSQRQNTIERLNADTDRDDERNKQIDAEKKKLFTDENDLWNIFKAKTGFVTPIPLSQYKNKLTITSIPDISTSTEK